MILRDNIRLFVILLGLSPVAVFAGEVRVAMASNVATAMEAVAQHFEAASGHRVVLSAGSTGKHFAQIRNGAPYDVFFAADARRPELLEQAGQAVPGTRFTYAIGTLVLWSPRPGRVDPKGAVLREGAYRFLAMANPALAPYGRAAEDVLRGEGLWDKLQGRIVRGENVAQAYQYVVSGNTDLGFVALAQIQRPDRPIEGSYWIVPRDRYAPIEQQAVLLTDTPAARALLAFVRSDEALKILEGYGYNAPNAE